MAVKEYAPQNRGAEPPPPHDFAMIFIRDGVEERHEFSACPTMSWQDIRGLVPVAGSGAAGSETAAVRVSDRLIRRALRNDDGTPEKWVPVITDGHFTDPNGDHTPVNLLPAYQAFDAGSSRRRWVYLMEEDDDVTVEAEQILTLVSDLVEAAAVRPTSRSAPSSR